MSHKIPPVFADDTSIAVLFDSSRSSAAFESIQVWFSKAGEISECTTPVKLGEDGDSETAASEAGHCVTILSFPDSASVDKALSLRWKKHGLPHGSEDNKWIKQHEASTVDPRDLQEEVDALMAQFERQEEAEAARLRALEGMPDADGFVTVTRKSVNRTPESKNLKKKRKIVESGGASGGLQLGPFYKFQGRETKRNRTCGSHFMYLARLKIFRLLSLVSWIWD